jgi:3'(2'), 5'-bisphosphate nucleotidase
MLLHPIDLDLARQVADIARAAGAATMTIYRQADFGIQIKSDDSPVTQADLAANAVITEGLKKLEPHIPIVSEESTEIPYAVRKDYAYHWCVDPIDGTKEFIAKNDEFTVNIALIHQNRPILGVIYAPALDILFFAVQNLGAYRIEKDIETPLSVNSYRLNDDHLRIPISRSFLTEGTKNYIQTHFKNPILTPKGSTLKLCMLASGAFDLYVLVGTTSEWDTASADIIVWEAGGQMLELESHTPMRYNRPNLKNPNFIVYGRLKE